MIKEKKVIIADEVMALIKGGFKPDKCPKCEQWPYVYVKPVGSTKPKGDKDEEIGEPILLHYVKCNTADCNTAGPDMGGDRGRQRAIYEWNRRARHDATSKAD